MSTSLCNARMKKLSYQKENNSCADCSAMQSQWVSVNIGCFLCMRCAGIHRSIGVHITKIKSVSLDYWTENEYNFMRKWGNIKVNSIYEATVPKSVKPTSKTGNAPLKKFIQDKYVHKMFYRSPPKPKSPPRVKELPLIDVSFEENSSGFGFI